MSGCGSVLILALPPVTVNGQILFAKNSNRPATEVHEVVNVVSSVHETGTKLMCTYGEVDQNSKTHAVILSKPNWSWGAEMGANEHGVCIGCSFQSRSEGEVFDSDKGKLLSTDLVRLGLERSTCCREALDVIITLLEKYGLIADNFEQVAGSEEDRFCTSFLISDRHDAWVLEVVTGKQWAAEHVTNGVRWIAGHPTIKTKIDLASKDCQSYAVQHNWWSEELGDFNFCIAYSNTSAKDARDSLALHHDDLLLNLAERGNISSEDVLVLIRKLEADGQFSEKYLSISSQMSVLPSSTDVPCCHWFTATPLPSKSLFKPFIFCDNASVGDEVSSPNQDHSLDRSRSVHRLYAAHREFLVRCEQRDARADMVIQQLRELESNCLQDLADVMDNYNSSGSAKVSAIFSHITNLEMNFY